MPLNEPSLHENFLRTPLISVSQGSQTQINRGPHEDLQGNPRAALWCWRNNNGTWT